MANKTLNANVKINTTSAEASLTRLTKKINNVQKAVNKTGTNAKLAKAIDKAVTKTNKLQTATNKWATATNKVATATAKVATTAKKVNSANQQATNSARKLSSAYKSSNSSANGLLNTVKRLASTYLGVMGTKAVINTSDTITSAENRLNALNGNNSELTQNSMDKVYAASQRSRSGYSDMLGNVSKSMTLAGDAFQGNVDNAIRFQEIMAKAYTIGGASAAEQSSSMYQLVQALGSGVLQGDELRSVREGAPIAYKKIEEFAQGVLNTEESLKDLASQGVITSDIIVAAIMDSEKEINASFNKTKTIFAQTWNQIKNTAMKAFEPVLQKLNEILNSDAGRKVIEGICKALIVLADDALWVLSIFEKVLNWCVANWNWLKYVIIGVGAVIIGYLVGQALVKLAHALTMVNWKLVLITVAIVLVLMFFEYLCAGAAWVGAWIVNILSGIWNFIVWLLQAIISGVVWLGATICNIVIGLINAVIQICWAVVEPIIGIIEWILNACNGGFNSFGGAVANLIGQIISWFLSLGKVVTKIIDAIFGTDWTSGLNSLQEKVLSWGKKDGDESITINREAPEIKRIDVGNAVSATWNGVGKLHTGYVDANEWANNAGNWGLGVKDSLFGKAAELGNSLGGLLDPNNIGLDGYDPSGANDDIADALKKIGGDTGDIADSMDLTQEDLEYLRRVADMEWKKEFTTANITVDMSNYNTINGDGDLDGIVDKLADKLYDEMNAVANGVYE